MKFLLLALILMSCSKQQKKVLLIKQWHLSSQTNTTNIEQGRKLPHFENQMDIYKFLVEKIQKGEVKTLIAEGCEGELDQSLKFNGWSLNDLRAQKEAVDFQDILAPIPFKLKIKFPKLKVVCGDNEVAIEKNLEAASNMRGFYGFYSRLKEAKESGNTKKYEAYATQMRKLFSRVNFESPLNYAREGVSSSIEDFEKYVLLRNESFLKTLKKHASEGVALVVGGLHVRGIEAGLKKAGLETELYIPKGYKDDEQELLNKFKGLFAPEKYPGVSFFLVSEGFEIDRFPFKKNNKIAIAAEELETLKSFVKKGNLPESLLTSDYDEDGIRDFTLSSSGDQIIISPEDTDWDNDGIDNLIDPSVGQVSVATLSLNTPLANNYLSKVEPAVLVKKVKAQTTLIQETGTYHELLVLEVFHQLISKLGLPVSNIKYIRSANLNLSYGNNSFFNYVRYTQTLNYDPKKLNRYVKEQFEKNFKGAAYNKYINSYVIPLIIHSIAHEIGHSLDFDIDQFARTQGWSWDEEKVNSSYLKNNRDSQKIILTVKKNKKFRHKSHKQWLKLYKEDESKFLSKYNLASVYATSDPQEWFAEMYAMCKFRKIYPNFAQEIEKWSLMLGINPAAAKAKFCLNL